jgi:regulator of sigma E protease
MCIRDSVNGQPIRNWDQFLLRSALYPEVQLEVRSLSGEIAITTVQTDEIMGSRYVRGVVPFAYCRVIRVIPGTSADEAGIQSGDELVEFDGHTLYSREHLMSLVRQHPDQLSSITVQRGGQRLDLEVRPRYDAERGVVMIGVEFNTLDVKHPTVQIKGHLAMIFNVLKALGTPRESKAAASSLGGPVAIFGMFWWSVQSSFILALWFTVLLNVNLAVLNLLPIPVLDGGHIMFSLWESVTRRPVGPRVVNAIWNVFAILLLLLFVTLTYRDILRFATPRSRSAPAPVTTETNAPAETP